MYILAIETTGPKGSVAIIDEQENVCLKISKEEMNHLKDLMPMAQQITDELGIRKSDITAVAASVGPGSFTGIRIGVASARTIAQALSVPAVSVPTLDSFKLKCKHASMTVPVFNARRGQVYGGVFDKDGGDILKSGPYMLTDCFAVIETELKKRQGAEPVSVKFYGDGIDAYASKLETFAAEMTECYEEATFMTAEPKERYQTAEMTARCALEKYRRGEILSAEELLPDYMRETEAEQKLKDGSLARERAAKMARFMER